MLLLAILYGRLTRHRQETLTHPDERQITKGIKSTEVPAALKSLVDALVWESTRAEEGCVFRVLPLQLLY